MRHAGIPVTREQISEQVWKQPFDPTTNIVDVYINYLRKKLETDGAAPLVHTVTGSRIRAQGTRTSRRNAVLVVRLGDCECEFFYRRLARRPAPALRDV